eukprot:TRINITY_DN13346_c0_g2_i4.p1 TRINITY_DN13346_c0_g2~~TRINITY_DN13346_c0_g2_i4.p1  ORF type:complete len:321 (-),score=28.06 TRINITY_DN13346_c0_g2_i4:548-1486(-)
MIRRPPRSTPLYSSAASDVYKRQLLILCLLFVSVSCYTFKWNKFYTQEPYMRIQHIAHQGDNNGDMHMLWEKQAYFNNEYMYANLMKATYNSYLYSIGQGFERASIQVSKSGKTQFMAYFGCIEEMPSQNVTLLPCSQVFTRDSANSGNSWSEPRNILTGNVKIDFDVPITTIRDKEMRDIFVFFASKTNESHTSEVVVYHRHLRDPNFRLVAMLPKIKGLVSIDTGYTLDPIDLNRYLHLFLSDRDTLYYTRSVKKRKTLEQIQDHCKRRNYRTLQFRGNQHNGIGKVNLRSVQGQVYTTKRRWQEAASVL